MMKLKVAALAALAALLPACTDSGVSQSARPQIDSACRQKSLTAASTLEIGMAYSRCAQDKSKPS